MGCGKERGRRSQQMIIVCISGLKYLADHVYGNTPLGYTELSLAVNTTAIF